MALPILDMRTVLRSHTLAEPGQQVEMAASRPIGCASMTVTPPRSRAPDIVSRLGALPKQREKRHRADDGAHLSNSWCRPSDRNGGRAVNRTPVAVSAAAAAPTAAAPTTTPATANGSASVRHTLNSPFLASPSLHISPLVEHALTMAASATALAI
jgi:hypothetical protein